MTRAHRPGQPKCLALLYWRGRPRSRWRQSDARARYRSLPIPVWRNSFLVLSPIRHVRRQLRVTGVISEHSAQACALEPEPVQLSVGPLASGSEHLVGVLPHWRAARCGYLLGQCDHALRGRSRIEPAALHAVERVREGFERLTVQLALLVGHSVRYPLQSCSRFRRPPGLHIACRSHDDIDAEALQLGSVDGGKYLHRSLGGARWPVERERHTGCPGAHLDYATTSLPQGWQERIHDGDGAEHVDVEFVPDGFERQ